MVEMSDLIYEIDRIWKALQADEVLQEDALDVGIDVSKFAGMSRAEALAITTPAHGITGAELFDVTAVSAISGMHVVFYDLWKRVILPRLQQRFGKDAIKKHQISKKEVQGKGSATTRRTSRKDSTKKTPRTKSKSRSIIKHR
jgi:hypothetical protein